MTVSHHILFLVLFASSPLCSKAGDKPLHFLDKPAPKLCTTFPGLSRPHCPSRQKCVLSDFGKPQDNVLPIGMCSAVPPGTPACSVSLCSSSGAATLCKVPSGEFATCGTWATRRDNFDDRPNCDFVCTKDCPGHAIASNGVLFCNTCSLHAASCRASFAFFGPLSIPSTCTRPYASLAMGLRARCCLNAGLACLKEGKRCTMGGGTQATGSVPCAKGLQCALDDLGFPQAGSPSVGRCLAEDTLPKCSVAVCTCNGENFLCRTKFLDLQNVAVRCSAWASRRDGGERPDCKGLRCVRRRSEMKWCLKESVRPKGSDGNTYCKVCTMRAQSCKSGFKLRQVSGRGCGIQTRSKRVE